MNHLSLLYYVTGHGYGHARRSAEVIRALASLCPSLAIHLSTNAEPAIFRDILSPNIQFRLLGLDPGAIEQSVLTISPEQTLHQLRLALDNKPALIARELEFIRAQRISLIVADIPFLAGDVAEAAAIPCIAIANFTWDWIYEPWFADNPASAPLIRSIQASYAKMEAILKLPFGGRIDMFPRAVDVPLIVSASRRSRGEILSRLNLSAADPRPLVLIGQRGGLPARMLQQATRSAPDFRFLHPGSFPDAPTNVFTVPPGADVSFSDILRASDVVVSKLGYGTVSECIAANVAMLWPPRAGFREDPLMAREAAPFMRLHQIPVDDFEAGRWQSHLHTLVQLPAPSQAARTDGAEVCARWLLNRLGVSVPPAPTH